MRKGCSYGIDNGVLGRAMISNNGPISHCFAVLRLVTDRRTVGRTDAIGLAKGGTVH